MHKVRKMVQEVFQTLSVSKNESGGQHGVSFVIEGLTIVAGFVAGANWLCLGIQHRHNAFWFTSHSINHRDKIS